LAGWPVRWYLGGCAPPPPSLRATGVGRRGGEARCARRAPQRSPGKGVGWRRLRCCALYV
jgi:hypothetical protein